jgi:hypothetical protein
MAEKLLIEGRSRSDRVSVWCIAALLAIHAALGFDASRKLTVTHDEYWHLPAGLVAWRTGRFDSDNLNPPLTRMWDALPLIFTAAKVDPAIPAGDNFQLGDRFLTDNRARYERYLALARSMNVLFSALTGLVMALWAGDLFGRKSACLAAALWSFCPTALAHAALVTPDAGAACLFLATLFNCWRFSNRPAWRSAFLFGMLLGLAQLTKFTSLLLYPLCIAAWFIIRVRNETTLAVPWRTALGQWGCAIVVSLIVLNGGYLFEGSSRPLNAYHFQSRAMQQIAGALRPVDQLRVPLPRDYLEGLDHQRRMMEAPHPVYLDGRWSETGFDGYYLRALEYKLPHATQALCLLAGLFVAFPARLPRLGRVQALLWLPVVVLVVLASSIGMQLGIRYILPALPLAYLFAAQTARWLDWSRFRVRTLVISLAIVALPWSLRFHPHHLAYFNEFAGGPAGGREHLLDSNLDWGQDLGGVAQFIREHESTKAGLKEIGLAYFGMMPPSEMGIAYHIPPSFSPAPGWYAVSVNFAYGRPHTISNPDGTRRSADFQEFGYFRRYAPMARIGYSIDVYHITKDDISR